MRQSGDTVVLSAGDIAKHLGCRHLSMLDLDVALGRRDPPSWQNATLDALIQRGFEHEAAYVSHLQQQGLAIETLPGGGDFAAAALETQAALRKGTDVIVQATFSSGQWMGRADILIRVDRPSDLGDYSYEVVDTKLAQETKAGTILQLCLYSELLGDLQGVLPENMHVVPPSDAFTRETYRVVNYFSYYSFVKSRLSETINISVTGSPPETYPDPVPQCDVCRWWTHCDKQWRHDDHLSLVAGISRLQRRQLEEWGVSTLTELAALPLPLNRRPDRGSKQGYEKVREQARLQLEARQTGKPMFETLSLEPGRGLSRLPCPSPGDIFFDIEGDPFAGKHGLEYLFGYGTLDGDGQFQYSGIWSLSPNEEQRMFIDFIDFAIARWKAHPDLHIYHYAPYEPSALKRLMGRYAVRESEVDSMLRAGLFVDLYGVVRQAIRAGVEKYSIKDMEQFYDFRRVAPLTEASKALRTLELALESGAVRDISEDLRSTVEAYNVDDCHSTLELRNWLETLRADLVTSGEVLERPPVAEPEPAADVSEHRHLIQTLKNDLLEGIPAVEEERTEEEHATWLLAHMLDWHIREEKAVWWDYFRLAEMSAEELLEDKKGLAGLTLLLEVEGGKKVPTHRYGFVQQELQIVEGDELRSVGGAPLGRVVAIDEGARTIDIKKRSSTAEDHPAAVFMHSTVDKSVLEAALSSLGEIVKEAGLAGLPTSSRALLLRSRPKLTGGQRLGELQSLPSVEASCKTLGSMEPGVLPIQGPPGAGKTYTAARAICALLEQGKCVGITALSHKAIENLLSETVKAARESNAICDAIYKAPSTDSADGNGYKVTTSNAAVTRALQKLEVNLVAGTPWLWARTDMANSVDFLFVDEAGQLSLANVLACSPSCESIVLVGDQQQLEQPLQGSHPDGTEVSALQHILGNRATVDPTAGLFLSQTWRLHPEICNFTSKLFYEDRLSSHPALAAQRLLDQTAYGAAGLAFVGVNHAGNQSSSPEEAAQVATIANYLVEAPSRWVDMSGSLRTVSWDDILIIAPYNAQVSEIAERLPGARVGTVDKFQGQEAAVAIYSLTTSTPEDGPHGMEFLYDPHRFNVATSRGRCLCIVVAAPALLRPECRTPRQIELANYLCYFRHRSPDRGVWPDSEQGQQKNAPE